MRILGIDPGTIVMGYGIIESEEDKVSLVKFGVFKGQSRSPIGGRLIYFYNEILGVITRYQPDVMAIEQPFMAVNVKSALAIGRAQAVAILAAASREIPASEYTPAQIKQRVADHGASTKEQIQEMVRLQLGLAEVPQPDDAADALAVAICHLREMHLNSLLARGES
jgi:crossover junction endodeoxyribonuclease RuvC